MGLVAVMEWPAWALDAWVRAQPYADRLAVWRGYERELQTLLIYGIGIALYTALVFAFYQNLSKRKPFHSEKKKGWWGKTVYFLESALVFPVMSFFYFAVLAMALFLMAKSQTTQQILLVSMGVVVGVRVTSYLSEKMSNDLAKLVPLGLLGVLLVDPGYLSLETTWARIFEAANATHILGRYFLLFIALEAAMGAIRWTVTRVGRAWKERRGKVVPVMAPAAPDAPAAPAPDAAPAEPARAPATLTLVVKEGSTPSSQEPAQPGKP